MITGLGAVYQMLDKSHFLLQTYPKRSFKHLFHEAF
jgi:hypothetical protein